MCTVSFMFPNNLKSITGFTYKEWTEELSKSYTVLDYWNGGNQADCIIVPESIGWSFTNNRFPRFLRIDNQLFRKPNFDEIRSQVARFIQNNYCKDK
ncbi:hypothetical protein [Enterococcus avium]|uniref:hypothetical protein n=1 Tax=Enterococcus avium TaxID=33945 RepID=UPI0028905BEE|nr:hypothetical protein [Enterococcus avium]MDT2437415.1 hypothetical protein [Enterococcus avium]